MTEPYLNLEPATDSPRVVLVAGIPGTGKSTLAESLARQLKTPVFSMDWVMGALVLGRAVTDENAESVVDLQLAALVEGRSRGIPGWHATVPWQHVERMRGLWEPWEEDHLVLDSAVETPESSVKLILDVLGR